MTNMNMSRNLKFHTVSIMNGSLAQAVHAREGFVHAKMVVPSDVDAARRRLNATVHAVAVETVTGEMGVVDRGAMRLK